MEKSIQNCPIFCHSLFKPESLTMVSAGTIVPTDVFLGSQLFLLLYCIKASSQIWLSST